MMCIKNILNFMRNTDVNKINNLLENEKKFKEAHYEFLTTFSYLEMLISYYVSSYYCKNKNERMEFTISFLKDLSRPNLYEKFLFVLEKKQIQKDELFDKFIGLNNLRNDLAHSYIVPKKENLKKGFSLTKIFSIKNISPLEGFIKIIQDEEYEKKLNDLNELRDKIYSLCHD